MAITHKQSYIAVTNNPEHLHWLKSVFKEEGEIVHADVSSLERVRQIIDLTGAQVVFIAMTPNTLRQDIGLIEGLVASKPLLSIVTMGEQLENQMLLAAMRAGARDFILTGTRSREVINLIQRLQNYARTPNIPSATLGKITSLVSARSGTDTPMLALHLALAMQGGTTERKVLLLDLGDPAGDTLMYLGINSSYTFIDAVRSLRRLDSMLIDNAFAKHESGLNILSLPEGNSKGILHEVSSADIYVLLGVLRRYFSRIVINLGGAPQSDLLYLLLNNSNNALVLVEQSVPSCKQNMQFVRDMIEQKIPMSSVELVVDRYLSQMPPDAESLSRGFGLPLQSTLPPSGLVRLRMMNSGESLFKCAPRDPYTQEVQKLAKRIMSQDGDTGGEAGGRKSFLQTLKSWFAPSKEA